MSIYTTMRNILQIKEPPYQKNQLTLDDMVGRYKAIKPINCVKLKKKMK